ncbi:lipoyl protein ligase domain-containing protein [Leptolyngbya sp. KIOST-1]|uniref:lipoyl protein ligase domain-containing protein n=1 Tax=Leptolyngbya sp. KIOST-1 TaxID=1229172 RepID=UPI00055EA1D9|nr:biotin/lipoate A/B protein ligase family protein [Leptolyngbya sp. KIOST-1]
MSTTPWRLIPPLAAPGAMQMAIDTWLLDQHQHHGHPPTLRFYTWHPAAISLGVSQRRQMPAHWQNLVWQGQPMDLVPRPTGGRGVLHQGDLTYAVVTSQGAGQWPSHLYQNRHQLYQTLCQFLIQGWESLGVPLSFGQPGRDYGRSSNCFALATSADLIDAQGHKVIGSAQRRRGAYLLQHGSIALYPDPTLWQQVFQTQAPPPSQVQIAMRHLAIDQVVAALTQAASDCFGAQFVAQPLSPPEWAAIGAIAQKNGPECQRTGPFAVLA